VTSQKTSRRLTVQEAAELLGTSVDAVRMRVRRGSLASDKDPDGRVYVWVDADESETKHEPNSESTALISAKDETIRLQEEQLRLRAEEIQRRDVIISQLTQANAALAQRVPELEAPREPPGASESVFEEPEKPERAEPRAATGGTQEGYERPPDTAEFPVRGKLTRPWWRRVFGG
jgi:excisionase family DNA binding protein